MHVVQSTIADDTVYNGTDLDPHTMCTLYLKHIFIVKLKEVTCLGQLHDM
jgi:hypothetical protein